ncbi:hypothetical protein BJ878DRAFT_510378 [Calycina marina]|uniref:Uncharacterized protein n=1 Tax=Calycina marina TaxID=1763456 RepID=A0A9P8CE82_9HELO|nr:hypothetical protein BJ878DRAFT_510378 [Calycina marina]
MNKKAGSMERKQKTIFQLDTPFDVVKWPEISLENQDTILELLCSILSPIGKHRAANVVPSKGKRDKKRKRREAKESSDVPAQSVPPPAPEISRYIAVGLNSITRQLVASSHKSMPTQITEDNIPNESTAEKSEMKKKETLSVGSYFVAVFVTRTSESPALHEHLPQLIVTASLACTTSSPTRLVQLPEGSEDRLAQALGIPRVSFLGLLEGAPHSTSLLDLVREAVAPIEIPSLKGVEYLPVKINAIQTTALVPVRKTLWRS